MATGGERWQGATGSPYIQEVIIMIFTRPGAMLAAGLVALAATTALAQQASEPPGAPGGSAAIERRYLPNPPQQFQGDIEPNAAQSTPYWPGLVEPPEGAPNVLLVMIDDEGFAAPTTFGGVIPTPALDELAEEGLHYTRFHTTALCSPARAALLTGRNHHSVSTGVVVDQATGYPGYDSTIKRDTVAIGEILKQNGYDTSWFGKDHNVPQWVNIADEDPDKAAALKEAFRAAAADNKVFPIGGGLWSVVFHPEDAPHNPATEFTYTQDVIRVPEFTAPKVGVRSNLMTIEAELDAESDGVLFALGAFSGGVALWVENGKLSYEYNLFEITRTRIETSDPLPSGKVMIEVETTKTNDAHAGPLDVVIRVNGTEMASGTVPQSAPLTFTANYAFDVGRDCYSPVSEAYYDRKPFEFNGHIERLKVVYTQ